MEMGAINQSIPEIGQDDDAAHPNNYTHYDRVSPPTRLDHANKVVNPRHST
jgi:hypothetical protein